MTIDRIEEVAQGQSDADLITATRSGDAAAYGQLYARHLLAARRLARTLTSSNADADDLVAEVFAKLLDRMKAGGGPDAAFRTYLLTSVRNTFYDRLRRNQKITVTDDVAKHDPGVPFVDTAVEGLERSLAARAFARLPERWQTVLWHTEVEGESAADVAPLLGLTPNGVSALAYRARERLRQAYLQEHLTDSAGADCGWTIERLGAHVRGGLANRESGKVKAHLSDCDRCRALYTELGEVNSGLRGVLAPLVLGGSAAAYLASGGKAALSLASFTAGARKLVNTWVGQAAVAGGGIAAATAVAITISPYITSPSPPEATIADPQPGTSRSGPADPSTTPTPGTSGSPAPGASGTPGLPGVPGTDPNTGEPVPGTNASPSPGAPSTTPGAPAPGKPNGPGNSANKPGKTAVDISFDPAQPLKRGTSSAVVLTLTNTGRTDDNPGKGPATARISAELRLPEGVTLAGKNVGDGWKCEATSAGALCHRPSVPNGQTTTAHVPVKVATNAASGVPEAIVTSSNIGTRTVQCSGGVVD